MSIVYASWNIKQLGESKIQTSSQVFGTQSITAIASYMKAIKADVFAVMEITLRTFGTDAAIAIVREMGGKWTGLASSNDSKNKPDRYGLFYNEATIDFRYFGWPDLIDVNDNALTFPNRNPGYFRLISKATSTNFYLFLLHGPEPKETTGGGALQAMKSMVELKVVAQQTDPIIISGDFNVDYNLNSTPYTAFQNAGYGVLFKGNKTSLKTKFKTKQDPGTYLKSAYDNIFLSKQLTPNATSSGVFDFVLNEANTTGLPSYANSNPQQEGTWQ